MAKWQKWLGVSAVLVATVALGAPVEKAAAPAAGGSEVRVGVYAHGVNNKFIPFNAKVWDFSDIGDVSLDLLLPDTGLLRSIGSPRPEIGATANLEGKDSLAHAAVVWQWTLFNTPIFFEFAFGAAINNGYLTGAPFGRPNFGCRINFYERFGLGLHLPKSDPALTYEHTSNAALCAHNDGLTNVGVRVGWAP